LFIAALLHEFRAARHDRASKPRNQR
jgi:hypothetical protein